MGRGFAEELLAAAYAQALALLVLAAAEAITIAALSALTRLRRVRVWPIASSIAAAQAAYSITESSSDSFHGERGQSRRRERRRLGLAVSRETIKYVGGG